MKVQMLKMHGKYDLTVIKDTESTDYTTQYALYIHTYKMGKDGYRTKRKYLVDRCASMEMCLAWIMDILKDDRCLANCISAKKLMA